MPCESWALQFPLLLLLEVLHPVAMWSSPCWPLECQETLGPSTRFTSASNQPTPDRWARKEVTGTRWVTKAVAARMTAMRMRPRPPGQKDIQKGCRFRTWHWLWCWGHRPACGNDNDSGNGEMGVASGAAATAGVTVPVPSLMAVSTQPRRLAGKQQLPVPATESQGFWGWCGHNYHVQKHTFPMVYLRALCPVPPLFQTFAVIKDSLSLNKQTHHLPIDWGCMSGPK